MTIEEIIKEAFSQGWNASHECATDFDYEYALKNCLSELGSEVKKLNIPAVSNRREQLIAFAQWLAHEEEYGEDGSVGTVDAYLESN